jgi:hypothetical protein
MGQLSREMAEAIDANARNKVYFALAPKDAIDQSHHVKPWLDDGDLMRLGGYEVVLRPVAAGRAARPVTADTLPPPQRQPGRAEQLRQAARRHTGLSQRIRRRLLADALTQPAVEPGDSENNVEDNPVPTNLVGINTFPPANPTSSRARRGERPREGSAVPRNDTDRSGDHTPLNSPSAHVNDDEEDPWTGTD